MPFHLASFLFSTSPYELGKIRGDVKSIVCPPDSAAFFQSHQIRPYLPDYFRAISPCFVFPVLLPNGQRQKGMPFVCRAGELSTVCACCLLFVLGVSGKNKGGAQQPNMCVRLVVKHGDVYFGLAATMSGCEEIAPR